MKAEVTKVLIILAVATVLASIALTFAQPYYSMNEEANAKYHDEGEEQMEQMREECTEMRKEMYHADHHTSMHNETTESHGQNGCH
jgi:hypothetical protein